MLVRPTMTAPASSRLRTSGEWSGAIRPANAGRPLGVGCPATSMFSLIVTGTPCRDPSAAPSATSRSLSRALRIASPEQSDTMALRRPLCAAMRPSTDSVTSTHDTSRARIIAASSTALLLQRPLSIASLPLVAGTDYTHYRRGVEEGAARGSVAGRVRRMFRTLPTGEALE